MRSSRISPILVVALVLTSAGRAAPQSLADVARAEQARRKATTGPTKTYTNDDLAKADDVPRPPQATGTTPATPAKPAAPDAKAAPGDKPAQGAPPAAVKDEKYWRTRIADAKVALQRNQAFLEALQSQINGLYTEFVNMGDPAKRALIEKRRLAALAEQDRLKADIALQTKAIVAIEDEARRAGVPAGWLR